MSKLLPVSENSEYSQEIYLLNLPNSLLNLKDCSLYDSTLLGNVQNMYFHGNKEDDDAWSPGTGRVGSWENDGEWWLMSKVFLLRGDKSILKLVAVKQYLSILKPLNYTV